MASCRTKTIQEIDDLSEMLPAMAALGISCKGLKTVDEMKAKVKEELNATVDKPSWTAGQVRIHQLEHIILKMLLRKTQEVLGTVFGIDRSTFVRVK